MMGLSEEQRNHYQTMLNYERSQIDDLDRQIEEELAKVKDRLAELQNSKKAARMMYDSLCVRLGIQNDLEEQDEDGASF